MKTAVQWLNEALSKQENDPDDYELIAELWDTAIDMERDQIKFFFEKGHLYSGCLHGLNEIYNKTYNNEQGE